jgi:hypothetical protein
VNSTQKAPHQYATIMEGMPMTFTSDELDLKETDCFKTNYPASELNSPTVTKYVNFGRNQ